jgi:hypothetical protein
MVRADATFKLVADRSPEDDDLASQLTLSRFENAISIKSLKWLRNVFIDQFIASCDALAAGAGGDADQQPRDAQLVKESAWPGADAIKAKERI